MDVGFYISLSWFLYSLSIIFLVLVYKKEIISIYQGFNIKEVADISHLRDDSIYRKNAILLSATISFIGWFILGFPLFVMGPFFFVLAYFLTGFLKVRARNFFLDAFDKELVDGLQSLSSSLKAGLTIQGAFEVAAKSTGPIFSQQSDRIIDDIRLGVHIDEALERVRVDIPTDNCNMAFGALIIGRQIGGPLPLILDRISHTLRERNRVEGRLRTLTAQGKGQASLICSLPAVIGIGTYLLTPERMDLMLHKVGGQLMLAAAIFLEFTGIFITLKMLKLEI
jgi:tight adherence protein B